MDNFAIPKGERVWVTYYGETGEPRFVITSKETNREFYFIYEVVGEKLKKLGKSPSPKELEVKYHVKKS